jgi:cytidine deaminase
MSWDRESLIAAARTAAAQAYAPYSGFHVGTALGFADGGVVTGANVENASYGLTLCAETVAVSKALSDGQRGGIEMIALIGGRVGRVGAGDPITPCGRCRQVLTELAQLDGCDPMILCVGEQVVLELRLSELLPHSFGPATLA